MISPQMEQYYEKLRSSRRQAYRQLNETMTPEPELIFMGDSITEWFPIEDLLPLTRPWANRGIAASTSRHLLDHLDAHLFGQSVTQVVLLIGTNDLGYQLPQEETLETLKQLIRAIKQAHPKAKIYLLEILPVNEATAYQEAVTVRRNRAIRDLNEAYAQLAAADKSLELVATYEAFLDDQGEQLDPDLTKDGLHLSPAGYQVLANLLTPHLL